MGCLSAIQVILIVLGVNWFIGAITTFFTVVYILTDDNYGKFKYIHILEAIFPAVVFPLAWAWLISDAHNRLSSNLYRGVNKPYHSRTEFEMKK